MVMQTALIDPADSDETFGEVGDDENSRYRAFF